MPQPGIFHGDRIVGLQFHLECSPEGVEGMVRHGIGEIVAAPFMQTRGTILSGGHADPARAVLFALLEGMSRMGQA